MNSALRKPVACRPENYRCIDAATLRFGGHPAVHPWRQMQHLVHRANTACERVHRTSLEIAQVLGTREGHVHRPDEDGTVPLFEYLVEPGVVPQPGTDPHEAQALVGGTADSCFHPFANLVPEPARMLDGPVRAAMPLRDHRVRHLLPDG